MDGKAEWPNHPRNDTSFLMTQMLGQVQTPNLTCAEPNSRVKCMRSATFESIKLDCFELNATFAVSATETVEDST